jgi:TetR/AcrR family transcriptional repressor of mexCD-oprJ operon
MAVAKRNTTARRADAERSIAAIINAGLDLFNHEDEVSMSDVARAAGLGRVTVYAHFPTRAELLEALLDTTIVEAEQAIATALGDAPDALPADEALTRLVGVIWPIVDRYRNLRRHALVDLGSDKIDIRHDPIGRRIHELIRTGQAGRTFRTDLPAEWLVTVVFSLTHAAADQVNAGHLTSKQVPGLLTPTILAALRNHPN